MVNSYEKGRMAYHSGVERGDNPFAIKEEPKNGEVPSVKALNWWKGWDNACYNVGLEEFNKAWG